MSLQSWLRAREMRSQAIPETIIMSVAPLYESKGETVIDRNGEILAICHNARIAKALATVLSRIKWHP